MTGTLGSKERKRVIVAESKAAYAEPGFLLYHRGNAVYAQPFNWKKGALTGEETRVADEVGYGAANGWSDFAVSPGGVLAYFQSTGSALAVGLDIAQWQLAWIDRAGKCVDSPVRPESTAEWRFHRMGSASPFTVMMIAAATSS
jgi:hypothetical protein